MTTRSDFDRIALGWVAEGPSELSDRVLQAALEEVHLTQQRRAVGASWRSIPMNGSSRLVAGVLVVVVAVGGAMWVLSQGSTVGPPAASPSAEPTSLTTLVRPGPTGFDVVHVSDMFGYGIRYPATWTFTAATIPNNPDYIPELAEGRADFYGDSMSGHGLMVTAAPLSGTRTDLAAWSAFVADVVPKKFVMYVGPSCVQSTRTLALDGEPANELDFYCASNSSLWVTAVHAGRAYQVVWLDDGGFDADYLRPIFDRFLGTFTFTR